jgi:hypothetical protein
MFRKPFKPPFKSVAQVIEDSEEEIEEEELVDLTASPRPRKKRRLIHIVPDSPPKATPLLAFSKSVNAPRKPLLPVVNPLVAVKAVAPANNAPEGYYMVLWYVDPYKQLRIC